MEVDGRDIGEPRFKVGDRVRHCVYRNTLMTGTITDTDPRYYGWIMRVKPDPDKYHREWDYRWINQAQLQHLDILDELASL